MKKPNYRLRCTKEAVSHAIVMTVCDLDGYIFFSRKEGPPCQKEFCFIPHNLIVMACRQGLRTKRGRVPFDPQGDYKQRLRACKTIARSCDPYQHGAIQHLIKMIIKDDARRKKEKKETPSNYYLPLKKDETVFGANVLALAEAFGVTIPKNHPKA